jgi:hypothetical protein
MNSEGATPAPAATRLFPSTFLIGILNAGVPDIWKWYQEQGAAAQRSFRQVIDIAFFKYLLQWQRRAWDDKDVVDSLISNMDEQSNAFSAAYNSNTYTKGVLRRIIRQTLQTWFNNAPQVPIETEATIAACMHIYLIYDSVHYVLPHEKLIDLMSIEQLKALSAAPLNKLNITVYPQKEKLVKAKRDKVWEDYKFNEERVVGVFVSHHITINTK